MRPIRMPTTVEISESASASSQTRVTPACGPARRKNDQSTTFTTVAQSGGPPIANSGLGFRTSNAHGLLLSRIAYTNATHSGQVRTASQSPVWANRYRDDRGESESNSGAAEVR